MAAFSWHFNAEQQMAMNSTGVEAEDASTAATRSAAFL